MSLQVRNDPIAIPVQSIAPSVQSLGAPTGMPVMPVANGGEVKATVTDLVSKAVATDRSVSQDSGVSTRSLQRAKPPKKDETPDTSKPETDTTGTNKPGDKTDTNSPVPDGGQEPAAEKRPLTDEEMTSVLMATLSQTALMEQFFRADDERAKEERRIEEERKEEEDLEELEAAKKGR